MRAYKGALLVISHDLDLLDEAITRVLHLERHDETGVGAIEEYKGTYSEYLVAREKDEVRLAKLAQRQAKEIDRLQTLVDRFGAKASQGRRWPTASRSGSCASRAPRSTRPVPADRCTCGSRRRRRRAAW